MTTNEQLDAQVNSGVKRLAINGDEARVIEFNPLDILFGEKFYALVYKFDDKIAEYQKRSVALEADAALDAHGIPKNFGARLALAKEACEFIRAEIDHVFGAGTSQTVFGDAYNLDAFAQFFAAITPIIQKARSEKIDKYAKKSGRVMR